MTPIPRAVANPPARRNPMRKVMLVNNCKYALLMEKQPLNFREAAAYDAPQGFRFPKPSEIRAIIRADKDDLVRFMRNNGMNEDTTFFTSQVRVWLKTPEVMVMDAFGNHMWTTFFDHHNTCRLLIEDTCCLHGEWAITL